MTSYVAHRRVDWGDCDAAGIVFYPNYFRWMDSVFHELTESAGFDQRRLQTEFSLLGTPLIDAGCSFKAPASYGDDLQVSAAVTRLGESGLSLLYRFACGDRDVAEGREARVFVKSSASGLAKAPIPASLRLKLEELHAR
ncbi:MAG: acyl-CoA thioesterase [Kiloniellales bacterium]